MTIKILRLQIVGNQLYQKEVLQKIISRLDWSLASEQNNEGFEIEHSRDGIDWEIIGFVAKNGSYNNIHTDSFYNKNPITKVSIFGSNGSVLFFSKMKKESLKYHPKNFRQGYFL